MKVEHHSFFDPFDEPAREALLGAAEHLIRGPGECLFEEGDEPDALYLILDGEIEVSRVAPDGQTVTLARIGPGDCLGEMGVFDGQKRSASARTVGQVRLARIPAPAVLTTVGSQPGNTVIQLLHTLSARLRKANEEYLHVVFNAERQRMLRQSCGSLMRWSGTSTSGTSALADGWQAVLDDTCTLHPEPISITEAFAVLEGRYASLLSGHGVTLEVTPCDGAFHVDPIWLYVILENLLLNASEAWPTGRATHIGITALWRPSEIEITIADNGPGIPAHLSDRACAPFVTSRPNEALGLGLAVCQTLIEAHNGTLRLLSPTGGGTTVLLTLPTHNNFNDTASS